MIDEVKKIIHMNFKMKELGEMKYLLVIEIIRSKKGILLNQNKYVLDIILEVGLSGGKTCKVTT